MKYILHVVLLLSSLSLQAKNTTHKKNKVTLFASWGYNRAHFTKSAIHFQGDDYNFTLKNISAKDRQSPFDTHTYFDLRKLTIPQYNFCVGITLRNDIRISVGQDHMKYVVQQHSLCTIDGYIHNSTEFAGDYTNVLTEVTPNFLQFEHTDGLNYVHLKIAKQKKCFDKKIKSFEVLTDIGIHAGAIIPRSDITLMHYNRNDEFHLAGYGLGVHAGIKAVWLRYIFVGIETKVGYINMPNILTRGLAYKDRAQQHFCFAEFFFSLGLQCPF